MSTSEREQREQPGAPEGSPPPPDQRQGMEGEDAEQLKSGDQQERDQQERDRSKA